MSGAERGERGVGAGLQRRCRLLAAVIGSLGTHDVVPDANRVVIHGTGQAEVIVVSPDRDVFGFACRVEHGSDRVSEDDRRLATRGSRRKGVEPRGKQLRGGGAGDQKRRRRGRSAGRRVVHECLRPPEECHESGWQAVQSHNGERGRALDRISEAAAAHDAGTGRQREHHQLPRCLLGCDQVERVPDNAAKDDRQGGRDERITARRQIVHVCRQRGSTDREGGRRVERPRLEGNRLEVSTVVPGGDEPHPFRFGGDVVGALHVAECARFAALHRVVGENVEAGHQVRGSNRGDGGGGGMFQG